MPMSAVHNPFQHHTTGNVVIPLVLGASSVNYNKQVFNAGANIVGGEIAETLIQREVKQEVAEQVGKEMAQRLVKEGLTEGMGKAARKQLTEEVAQQIFKEGAGQITESAARKMARKQVTKEFYQQSLTKGGKWFAKRAGQYGALVGIGWAFFRFGNGAVGALGDVLGEAGADTVNGTLGWMGDNPGVSALAVGFVIFLVAAAVIPAVAGKKVKDSVTKEDSGEDSGE